MGGLSIQHLLILFVLAVLLLGKGKVSSLMGDVAQGIKSFKKHMADDAPDASMAGNNANPGKIAQEDTVRPAATVRETSHQG